MCYDKSYGKGRQLFIAFSVVDISFGFNRVQTIAIKGDRLLSLTEVKARAWVCAGERVYQDVLADRKGRLQIQGRQRCLRLHPEEGQAGSRRRHEETDRGDGRPAGSRVDRDQAWHRPRGLATLPESGS